MTELVTFTWDGVKRGAVASQAVGVSVLVYGMAFGLIAKQAGLSIIESTLISAFVYSGSAQLAAVTTISEGDIAIMMMLGQSFEKPALWPAGSAKFMRHLT